MAITQRHSDSLNVFLSTEQFDKVTEHLSNLAEKLRITAVILVDSSGRTISQKVRDSTKIDMTVLSTLAASSYAAAKEMAKILGEKSNFKMMLLEGNQYNMHIAHVSTDYFLVVVFEPGIALGMVRLFTKKTTAQLIPILTRREEGSIKLNRLIDQRFQSLLGDELDRSLTELP